MEQKLYYYPFALSPTNGIYFLEHIQFKYYSNIIMRI